MKTVLWLFVIVASLAAQRSSQPPMVPNPNPPGYDPCATGETPCDPNRPWMRGTVEKYCGRTPADIARMKKANPLVAERILLCECKHMCDTLNEHGQAEATGGLAWDGQCQTRCNPQNCSCENPCES